jgi:hypothetical protein
MRFGFLMFSCFGLLAPLTLHCGDTTGPAENPGPVPTSTATTPPTPPPPPPPYYLYFSQNDLSCGGIYGVPKGGGADSLVWAAGCNQVGRTTETAFVWDATNLYVATLAPATFAPPSIIQINLVTGRPLSLFADAPDSGALAFTAMAVDATSVYFAES